MTTSYCFILKKEYICTRIFSNEKQNFNQKANNKHNSMYAIVEIAGQQFKVAKDQKVYVHRLKEAEGSKSNFR